MSERMKEWMEEEGWLRSKVLLLSSVHAAQSRQNRQNNHTLYDCSQLGRLTGSTAMNYRGMDDVSSHQVLLPSRRPPVSSPSDRVSPPQKMGNPDQTFSPQRSG